MSESPTWREVKDFGTLCEICGGRMVFQLDGHTAIVCDRCARDYGWNIDCVKAAIVDRQAGKPTRHDLYYTAIDILNNRGLFGMTAAFDLGEHGILRVFCLRGTWNHEWINQSPLEVEIQQEVLESVGEMADRTAQRMQQDRENTAKWGRRAKEQAQ